MGNPLEKGKQYSVNVSKEWKDVQGLPLKETYTRVFIVGERDNASPQLRSWKLSVPGTQTIKPLQITTHEPLDYFLLQETIKIINEKGDEVDGYLTVMNQETSFEFIPASPWQTGTYRLRVASYLEDLAGNNLQRLFDRDITAKKETQGQPFAERDFAIGPAK
jgi:hypothetical protein